MEAKERDRRKRLPIACAECGDELVLTERALSLRQPSLQRRFRCQAKLAIIDTTWPV